MRNQHMFDKTNCLFLQQEKIQALQSFADLLINGEHYDSEAIQDKRDQVLDRWSQLKEALIDNRSKLGEAQTLQQFSRDADEMENWLQEKLQIAMDESYKDPTNIQVSVQCRMDVSHQRSKFSLKCKHLLKNSLGNTCTLINDM